MGRESFSRRDKWHLHHQCHHRDVTCISSHPGKLGPALHGGSPARKETEALESDSDSDNERGCGTMQGDHDQAERSYCRW